MSRRALAPLLAAALAACGAEPSPAPASLSTVGPLRVGMPASEASRTLSSMGFEVECRDRNGISECRTVHTGMIGVQYEVAGDRVRSATRLIGSDMLPAPAGEVAARWEARYGPQDAAEAPAIQKIIVIRHWYREKEGVYRVNLCGNHDGMQACLESAMEVTPAAVAARVMSEAWEARDVAVICRTWDDALTSRCDEPDHVSVWPLQSGEVMRIAVLRGARETPAGAPLFESDGVVRHRMWRVPDGSLYGISCRNFDDREACWEIAARYEPRQLLAASIGS
ncbi:MAG TPA: hypothetical protein VFR81_01700 [Longimicrobium sp.]|nr:hypothetical protein [Longimicrobium sp.]